jgi:hypothetical protein
MVPISGLRRDRSLYARASLRRNGSTLQAAGVQRLQSLLHSSERNDLGCIHGSVKPRWPLNLGSGSRQLRLMKADIYNSWLALENLPALAAYRTWLGPVMDIRTSCLSRVLRLSQTGDEVMRA